MRSDLISRATLLLAGAASTVAWAQQTINLHSGNGSAGGSDSAIRCLAANTCGVRLRNSAFMSADFAAARSGPFALISGTQHFQPLTGCTSGPSPLENAAPTPGGPDRSALYAIPFVVNCSGPATMHICWRVDDSLGDYNPFSPNPDGLYLTNSLYPGGVTIPNSGGGNYSETCRDYSVTGLLAPGQNWLYLYVRDGGCAFSGLEFCATISIQQPTTAWLQGTAYVDANCDGAIVGDPPLAGVTVIATHSGGQQFTATTDSAGFYYIPNAPYGTYSLTPAPLSGYKTPCTAQTVSTGTNCVSTLPPLLYCPCPAAALNESLASNNGGWQIIAEPAGVPGLTPRLANWISAWSGWAVANGWIGPTPTSHISAPVGDYTYEYCFCLDERFSNPAFNLCFWADDDSSAYLNGILIGNGAAYWATNCASYQIFDPAMFRPGENCIEIVVHNTGGATGLNVQGSMTATNGRCCQQPCPCVPPPPDMTGWWMLDELSGTSALDPAGSVADTGTHLFGAAAVVGQVAACRDYTSGQYTTVADSADLNVGTGPFSIDAWIRTSDPEGVIVSKVGPGLTPNQGYELRLRNGGGNGELHLVIYGYPIFDGGAQLFGISLNDNQWHHVAATVQLGAINGIKLYVDGIPETFDAPPAIILDNSAPLRIAANSGTTFTPAGEFVGQIDEVELFKRILTPAEVYGLWRAGSNGKCRPTAIPCTGDLNGDQLVDLLDLTTQLAHFGLIGDTGQDGDINGDSLIDLLDLTLMLSNFGATCQ